MIFLLYSELIANPDRHFTQLVTVQGKTYQIMTDVPWLPSTIYGGQGSFNRATMMNGNTWQVPGIVLDYEVSDYRSPVVTAQFFRNVALDMNRANARLFLWTNPLDRTANTHGLDPTNIPLIVNKYCDFTSIQLWSKNPTENVAQSYENQIAMVKGYNCLASVPYGRLVIVLDLTTGLADAQFVNNLLKGSAATNPQAIAFWRNGAVEGGACGSQANNQIIAALEGSAAVGSTAVAPTSIPQGWTPFCPVS